MTWDNERVWSKSVCFCRHFWWRSVWWSGSMVEGQWGVTLAVSCCRRCRGVVHVTSTVPHCCYSSSVSVYSSSTSMNCVWFRRTTPPCTLLSNHRRHPHLPSSAAELVDRSSGFTERRSVDEVPQKCFIAVRIIEDSAEAFENLLWFELKLRKWLSDIHQHKVLLDSLGNLI